MVTTKLTPHATQCHISKTKSSWPWSHAAAGLELGGCTQLVLSKGEKEEGKREVELIRGH